MKKLSFLIVFFCLIINSTLLAFEDANFKVENNGWEISASGRSLVFFLDSSVPVVNEETGEEIVEKDLRPYVIVRISDLPEPTAADFSQKGLEDYKKKFEEGDFSRFANNYKNTIKQNILKKQPNITEEQADELVKIALGDLKINSSSIKKIGNFQAYEFDYKLGLLDSKHFIIPTLNKEYYVILQYDESINMSKIKQWDSFIKSFEIKDSAPTNMNIFIYGMGLKVVLVVILVLAFVIIKLVKRK